MVVGSVLRETTSAAEGLQTLDVLDRIESAAVESPPREVCLEVFETTARVGTEQMEEIIEYKKLHPEENIDKAPYTFEKMLDASVGNFAQRIAKTWIRPHNPEGTIKLLKTLQVDRFQKVAVHTLFGLLRRLYHIEPEMGVKSNYTLEDTSLNSLVDFATNQTGFNEVVHLVALAFNAAIIIPAVASGRADILTALNTGEFAINTYCVLAQRYTRARLTLAIDRALKKNREFNLEEYTNNLGIKFSENELGK